ncbi:hypothetical protein V9T40_008887 [Parthenolecanium corni]|uniref:p53 DNA-binding domain-containing protein n=1 Tax=Parthenolecanium corni TaxID=536013 RepID=A0AAN9Y711_9HEMI
MPKQSEHKSKSGKPKNCEFDDSKSESGQSKTENRPSRSSVIRMPVMKSDCELVANQKEESSYPDTEMGYLDSVVYEDGDRYDDPTGILPGTEDYAGPLNFQLFLNTEEKAKRSWLYSTTLKKLYIDINKVVCVQFKLKQPAAGNINSSKENLMLRALPVYSAPEFLQEPVCRCPVHVMTDRSNGERNGCSPWLYHVLRAEHHEAQYHMNRKSQRNSVVVPVHSPALGSEFVTIMYKFSCKTSCAFGLNRRPIHVIFTLETANGDIIGRRKLLVKVCSCPKRDLHRDEIVAKSDSDTNGRKRRIKEVDNSASFSSMEIYSPPSKEIKMESIDEEETVEDDSLVYAVPSFNIVGKSLYISTLELLHSHFIGVSVRNDSLLDMHPIISHFGELLDKVKERKRNMDTTAVLSFALPNTTTSSSNNINLSEDVTNEAMSTEVISD